jgi:hypothetical protein
VGACVLIVSKVKIIVVAVLCVLPSSSLFAAQRSALLNLNELADKSRSHIEEVLGPPVALVDDVFRSARGYTYPAIRATYQNSAIEVTYLEGGARYFKIWVQKLGEHYKVHSYPKDASMLIGDLGLDPTVPPELYNETVIRWRYFPNLYELSIFGTPEKTIWYVHVLTSRIYE